jgi:bacteriophage HK97-gp10 putative tail-component
MGGYRGADFELIGLEELEAQFRALGKFPKKALTKAAKAGRAEPLAKAKATAPRKTGALSKGIKYIMETPNKRTKTVYRMVFDRKYNDVFSKPIKNKGIYGGKKDTGYYPVSQEYGFKTKHGYKRGKYFIEKAIESTQSSSAQKILTTLNEEIDKILRG